MPTICVMLIAATYDQVIALSTTFIAADGGRTREDGEVEDHGSSAMTPGDQDCGQRKVSEEPAATLPADDEAGDRCRLSDSIVGIFDRLREAAETHDGD
jgi:hypothetical protein